MMMQLKRPKPGKIRSAIQQQGSSRTTTSRSILRPIYGILGALIVIAILYLTRMTSESDLLIWTEPIPAVTAKEQTITTPNGDILPSAKSLLTRKPPYDESNIITLDPIVEIIQSPNTIVTGYFRVPSKFHPGKYDSWMKNMLSLQDAMIIFTQPDLADQIKQFRQHATNRTVIVTLPLENLPIGTLYTTTFWQNQLDRDPEKRIHRSYQLFWIWLSKSWCVTQAIRLNMFQSDLFVWSDIGCFRNKKYNDKTLILHPELVPKHEIIQMAHKLPNPPPESTLYNDKYKHGEYFYHSGSQSAGYKDTWILYHEYLLSIIDQFLQRDMIIVDDQVVLQSTCLTYPTICAYVPTNQVSDNNYFGLRHVLHYGGNYQYWRYNPDRAVTTTNKD